MSDPKWVKSIVLGPLENSSEKVLKLTNVIIFGYELVNNTPNKRFKAVLVRMRPNFTFYGKRK